MEPHLRVEVIPRLVPVTAREATQAALDLGQALQDVGAAKAAGSTVEIERAESAYREAEAAHKVQTKQDGYLARINGAEFPLADFAVQYDQESGTPMLSLILTPDALSIGDPAAVASATAAATAPAITSWGDGSQPDPRESIPGWQPEKLAGQVAGHAERVALRDIPPTSWLRRCGDGGSVVVEIA